MKDFLIAIMCFLAQLRQLALLLCALGLWACASSSGNQTDISYKPTEESEARRRAKIRLELGVNYYQQKQFKTALDELASAILIDPDFADPYVMRGLILMEAKQNLPAEESFRQALKVNPKDPDANNTYGWFLCQTGRPEASLPYFALAADTPFYATPAKALQNAGICAAQMNDLVRADNFFQRALQLDANQAATLYHLSLLYVKTKDLAKANFYATRLLRNFQASPESLWLAIRIAHMTQDVSTKNNLSVQLKRDFPSSLENNFLNLGQFDR